MIKVFFLSLFISAAINAAAQNNATFKKLPDGTEYTIIPSILGAKINSGNYFEMNVEVKYKDSILFSTFDEGLPQYAMYDTATFPPPFKIIFADIKTGDVITVRLLTDSLIAKGQGASFMKSGQYVYQLYYPNNFFATKEQTDSAYNTNAPVVKARAYKKQLEMVEKSLNTNKGQIAKDSKIIEAYLAKNKIKATKTTWGTYIAVKKESTGNKLTINDTASVNYTGKALGSTKVFDSNTDPKFEHMQPYDVSLGRFDAVIIGWTDALLQMKNGAKATVYIPSSLAYGKQGRGTQIAPDAILTFDMAVVKVNGKAAQVKTVAAQQKAKPGTPSFKLKPKTKSAGK